MYYMYYIVGLFVICSFVSKKVIIYKSQKGQFVDERVLNKRMKLAIWLSCASILSFFITIEEKYLDRNNKMYKSQLSFVERNIQNWDSIPERFFVASLYSQETIDTIENDYCELKEWMDKNAKSVRKQMRSYEFINIDSLKIPVPLSSIANLELDLYRNNYIKLLNTHNDYIYEYKRLQETKDDLDFFGLLLIYVVPLLLMISIFLRLNIIYWRDAIEEKKKHG